MTENDKAVYTGYEQAHAKKAKAMFSRISGVYDFLNSMLSLGIDAYWRRVLSKAVYPFPRRGSGRILDLAAGTMKVSYLLSRRYPRRLVLAADFCPAMLQKGLKKGSAAKPHMVFPLIADGLSLPLPDNSVDAVTIAFGIRNILQREKVYAEVLRVLNPGAKFCILEFGSANDRILFGLFNFYLKNILPFVGRLVSRDKAAYRYLADTIRRFPSARALAEEMQDAGFESVNFKSLTAGICCLHVGIKPLR